MEIVHVHTHTHTHTYRQSPTHMHTCMRACTWNETKWNEFYLEKHRGNEQRAYIAISEVTQAETKTSKN